QNGLADHRTLAHDEIENALWQTGAMQDIDNRPGATRHEVSRLEYDGVAVAKRWRDFPCRNGDREIRRRDDADNADRLPRYLNADARTRRRQNFTGKAKALACEEIENLAGADGFTNTLSQCLAFLTRQETAKLVLAGENFIGGFAQRSEERRVGNECRA